MKKDKLNIYGIEPGSIVDGPGIRYVIFVQGCSHNCKQCHNPESHGRNINILKSVNEITEDFDYYPMSNSVTFSGGEPFDQSEVLSKLAKQFKKNNINIWCYTGYTFETLINIINKKIDSNQTKFCNIEHSLYVRDILHNVDVLVDGKFDYRLKSYEALFRGSTNQRLIDIKKSLDSNSVVLWKNKFDIPSRPFSW